MNNIDFPPYFNIQKKVQLYQYNNIRIGGPADYLTIILDQHLFIELYNYCLRINVPFLAIGSGTNILFTEQGFRGLVAIIKFDKITTVNKNKLVAEAGATLDQIRLVCINNGLSGFEFASGIPGTLGGAIYGNAGAYGNNIGQLLTRAKILTAEGKIKFVDRNFFKFSYRHSDLKNNPSIVLQTDLQLQKGDPLEIKKQSDEIIEIRTKKLPPANTATAGSWFKNLKDKHGDGIAAAKLLDAVDSKNISFGDAAVHNKHANILYNKAHATAVDILQLEHILQQKVDERFGVKLEREVMLIR